MTSRHNLSYAHLLFAGKAYFAGANSQRGLPVSMPIYHDFGAVAATDRDGLVTTVDPLNNAALTLRATVTGMALSGTTITLDTPRNVTVYGTADETAKSILVTGTDVYAVAMTEVIAGPLGTGATKITQGLKAFKTISSIVATGDFGTIEVGFGSVLGLPYRVTGKNQVLAYADGRALSPVTLTATITALGTLQETAVISPIGGVITAISAVSAAVNATVISLITITNASLEVGVLSFATNYAALAAITDTTLLNTRLTKDNVLKVATDGGGDGVGQATVTILVDPAVVAIGVDTTATTTTGDVRGTVDFGFAPDASLKFGAWIMPADRSEAATAYGVTQA